MRTRVVVADDSEQYLELLELLLRDVPQLQLVGTAVDGCEAVRLAVDRGADIALLDVEMPGLDGFGAASEIRRLRPQTRLLLHTGVFVDEYRQRGEQVGLEVLHKLNLLRTIEVLAGPVHEVLTAA